MDTTAAYSQAERRSEELLAWMGNSLAQLYSRHLFMLSILSTFLKKNKIIFHYFQLFKIY